MINLPFRKKLKTFLQLRKNISWTKDSFLIRKHVSRKNDTFILFRKKFHEKEILFFNSVSGFLFHDRRDIWSSVLRANQINSENGKNKANQPAASPDGFSMKSRPKKREIQSWKKRNIKWKLCKVTEKAGDLT